MEIIIPILALGLLGLIFGIGLAIASKKFSVHVDARLEKIHGLLPGANCGACGGAGCFGFAEMLLEGKVNIDACRVSEDKIREEIAKLLGKQVERRLRKVAALHCWGGIRAKNRFIYKGIEDCVAANLVLGGQKTCVYGCLGFRTCEKVCPFAAIKMSDEGLPIVDEDKCKACNKCVEICPKKLFTLMPVAHKVHSVTDHKVMGKISDVCNGVYVVCSSHDTGKNTRLFCAIGCIACGKCQKICPFDAIHVIDDLAIIDYHKCTSCGKCVEACPVKCIRTTGGLK